MCWRCDNPDRPIEDYLEELWAIIRDHGWAVQFVEDEKRPFAYTIGLHDLGVPELLISGVSPGGATHVLNSVARRMIGDGMVLAPAMRIDCQDGPLIAVIEVEHPDVHLTFAIRLFGPQVRALQLVWADGRGRWPWDPGWRHGRLSQPVLGLRGR